MTIQDEMPGDQVSAIEPSNAAEIAIKIQAELDAHGISDYKVGDWLISDNGELRQIISVEMHQGEYDKEPGLRIGYKGPNYESHFDLDYLGKSRGDRKHYYKLHGTPESVLAEGIAALTSPNAGVEAASTTTALATSASTDRMKAAERELEMAADKAMVLRLMVERQLSDLKHKYDKAMKMMHYTRRVIDLLETFLGVYEQVEILREGELAPIETPITIRQLILWMDEEVGAVDENPNGQKGVDFENINKFDAWLLADDAHLNGIAPELKCIVALRPSGQRRKYSDNPYDTTNSENQWVYLLIRNGNKLARIWANMKMQGKDRLFPTSAEMEKLTDALNDEKLTEDKELTLKHQEIDWRQNAVLIEGLFERTDLFQPTPERVSLFDRGSYERDRIRLIRDAEPALDDGTRRPRYAQWHKEINVNLQRGDRILIATPDYDDAKYGSRYFKNIYRSPGNYPPPAPAGIYVIDSVERRDERDAQIANNWYNGEKLYDIPIGQMGQIGTHTEHVFSEYLTFLYIPNYGPYGLWSRKEGYRDSKQRIRFYVRRDDWFVLNYDRISLDDVRYYINNRLERKHYLQILPTLYGIRAERLAEQVYEQPFVTLIVNELGCTETDVWAAVDWWKFKVIGHRGLGTDEAKAWRMIRKRVKNPTYLDLKESPDD